MKEKRPNKGIKKKKDVHPTKPDFEAREHYKNAEELKREIRQDNTTKPKSPRADVGHLKRRIEDLEELLEFQDKGK